MSKLGSKSRPARVRVQTEKRAIEMLYLCDAKGWQVMVGIEVDKPENIDDIKKLQESINSSPVFKTGPSRNAPCPCGSGKQFKRCCGK